MKYYINKTITADFGLVNDLEENKNVEGEDEWLVRASYILSRNFSIQAN